MITCPRPAEADAPASGASACAIDEFISLSDEDSPVLPPDEELPLDVPLPELEDESGDPDGLAEDDAELLLGDADDELELSIEEASL